MKPNETLQRKRMQLIFNMALVMFGNETKSGKQGNVVFARNTYGYYTRNWVKPVFPGTVLQMAINARFGSQSQTWRTLNATQVAGWQALAATVSFTNRLGQSIFLTGQAMFNKLNTQLLSAGQAVITTAPLYSVPSSILTLTGAAAAGLATFTATYTPTPVAVGTVMQIFATPQMSAGITFVSSQFRLLTNVAAAAASPANIHAAYIAQFGALVAGKRIQIKARSVSTTTGTASAFIKNIVTVAA